MSEAVRNDVVYVGVAASGVPGVLNVGIGVAKLCDRLSVKMKGVKTRLRNGGGTCVSLDGKDVGFGPERAQSAKEACLDEVVDGVTVWEGKERSMVLRGDGNGAFAVGNNGIIVHGVCIV